MVQFDPPPGFRSDPTVLLVGEDDRGQWQVHENHGRIDAVFACRDEAVRFAEAERRRQPDAVVLVTKGHVSTFPQRTVSSAGARG